MARTVWQDGKGPDGRTRYVNLTTDQLRKKLRAVRALTTTTSSPRAFILALLCVGFSRLAPPLLPLSTLTCRPSPSPPQHRTITNALGTTRKFSEKDPKRFRRAVEKFVDSANEVTEESYWPLVRRVRLYGRKWTLLKSGAVLVDAPGVNDDNSARDGLVKTYLKEANSIWVVTPIKRAVNDKTAKTMLSESFRRTLLMDGSYGAAAAPASLPSSAHPHE